MYEDPLFLRKSYDAYLGILCAQNTKCILVSIIFKEQNIHLFLADSLSAASDGGSGGVMVFGFRTSGHVVLGL